MKRARSNQRDYEQAAKLQYVNRIKAWCGVKASAHAWSQLAPRGALCLDCVPVQQVFNLIQLM